MSRLVNITIHNFRAFSEIAFSFEEKPLVFITAPNGKGKTSLMDAIEWCLTGSIKRLSETFEERNKANERNRDVVKRGVLKYNGSIGEARVELILKKDDQYFKIIRFQEEDSLINSSTVKIFEKLNDGSEYEDVSNSKKGLSEIVEGNNFYEHHVCNLHKTFKFLSKGRGDIYQLFSDFTSDYSFAKNVSENLNSFISYVDSKVGNLETSKSNLGIQIKKISENISKSQQVPENVLYDPTKLFESEVVDTVALAEKSEQELNEQLERLYGYGYKQVITLSNEIDMHKKQSEEQQQLEILAQELKNNLEAINHAISKKIWDSKEKDEKAKKLDQYNNIIKNLQDKGLDIYVKDVLEVGNQIFTKDYWEESSKLLKNQQVLLKKLELEVKVLSEGDKVAKILAEIVASKESLQIYREKRKQETGELVRCPVCASEEFDTIENDEIGRQAAAYGEENSKLLAEKIKMCQKLEGDCRKLAEEQLEKAIEVLELKRNELKKALGMFHDLESKTAIFFRAQEKLLSKGYARELLLTEDEIVKQLEKIKSKMSILNPLVDQERKISEISSVIKGNQDNRAVEAIKREAQGFIKQKVQDVEYVDEQFDLEALKIKVIAINSYIEKVETIELRKKYQQLKGEQDKIEKNVKSLTDLRRKAKTRTDTITRNITSKERNEYESVGAFLSQFLHKLSSNFNTSAVNLDAGQALGKSLQVRDEKGIPILNKWSDGELSVLMLSYFLGNSFKRAKEQNFKVYFIDDLTSCLDDINMLAFIDFVKQQVLKEHMAMDQLFFATCDSRIQKLLKHKLQNHQDNYIEIDTKKFE